jgi:diacylglycerol kinase (ATP)
VTPPRVAMVVNPAANSGRGDSVAKVVAEHLASAVELQVLRGGDAQESVDLIRTAAVSHDAVLVCGGDGLVHLAVNVLAEGDMAGPRKLIHVV